MASIQGYDNGSYRIRRGLVNAVELTAAYEVRRFPKQSDMKWRKWIIPVDSSNVVDEFEETNYALSADARQEGNGSLSWFLPVLTQDMLNYVRTSSTLFNGSRNGRFTIMTWSAESASWRVLWVAATIRKASESATTGYRQALRRLKIDFVILQDAPAGPDVTIEATTISEPREVSVQLDFILDVTNIGDGSTYDDIIVLIPTPAWADFDSASGASWTLEYFEGGAWVSSPSVPADVTNFRATYSGVVDPDAGTTQLNYSVIPDTSGSQDFEASVSTAGDTNTGNDDLTESLTIDP